MTRPGVVAGGSRSRERSGRSDVWGVPMSSFAAIDTADRWPLRVVLGALVQHDPDTPHGVPWGTCSIVTWLNPLKDRTSTRPGRFTFDRVYRYGAQFLLP